MCIELSSLSLVLDKDLIVYKVVKKTDKGEYISPVSPVNRTPQGGLGIRSRGSTRKYSINSLNTDKEGIGFYLFIHKTKARDYCCTYSDHCIIKGYIKAGTKIIKGRYYYDNHLNDTVISKKVYLEDVIDNKEI